MEGLQEKNSSAASALNSKVTPRQRLLRASKSSLKKDKNTQRSSRKWSRRNKVQIVVNCQEISTMLINRVFLAVILQREKNSRNEIMMINYISGIEQAEKPKYLNAVKV